MGSDTIRNILDRHKSGTPVGLYSVCSAHPAVLRAAARQAKEDGSCLLVESTSNQVDQFGGYSGMTPDQFVAYINRLAASSGLDLERVVFGGDHLGPNVWQAEPAAAAMAKARDQVAAYRKAGYCKFHLDATFSCAGDPLPPLPADIIAQRTADLCESVESIASGTLPPPVYVIGSDVPAPGGTKAVETSMTVTPVKEVEEILQLTRAEFYKRGLEQAWDRVIAVVVQPGVEFGNATIHDYDPGQARALSHFIESQERLVYEAHSTDYQTEAALAHLVHDHFALLKVGPWLTFAFREAVFALEKIEKEWLGKHKDVQLSDVMMTLEREMVAHPQHWHKHYQGTAEERMLARRYSLSDRIRYYWPAASVQASLERLWTNLRAHPAPPGLLSQYLPEQYLALRHGELTVDPEALADHKIRQVLAMYARATGMDRT